MRDDDDAIRLIEAAYRFDDEQAWLRGMLGAAMPLLRAAGGELGGMAWFLDARKGRIDIAPVATADAHPLHVDGVVKMHQAGPQANQREDYRRIYDSTRAFASTSTMLGPMFQMWPAVWKMILGKQPVSAPGDVLGAQAEVVPGVTVVLAAFTAKRTDVPHELARRWARLLVHVATAARLRYGLGLHGKRHAAPAAVLEPDGTLAHAEGAARLGPARKALSDAARAIDLARGHLRQQDPERAIALWRGLVNGRWSLVESIDSDGRRFVVAKENRVAPTNSPRTLSGRQAAVVHLAAQGHTNKLIAYELGLSEASIATHLRRAARIAGVASRVELVQWALAEASRTKGPT